jgi:hypothetical protein
MNLSQEKTFKCIRKLYKNCIKDILVINAITLSNKEIFNVEYLKFVELTAKSGIIS